MSEGVCEEVIYRLLDHSVLPHFIKFISDPVCTTHL